MISDSFSRVMQMTHRMIALAASLAALNVFGAPHYDRLVLSDSANGAHMKVFKPGTPKVFVYGAIADAADGTVLKAEWVAVKTDPPVSPPDDRISATEQKAKTSTKKATFALSAPGGGWPTGDYRVDLFIDGQPAGKVEFQVSK